MCENFLQNRTHIKVFFCLYGPFKETFKAYFTQGFPVFICFLDSSKTFDKLNHPKLFKILPKQKFSYVSSKPTLVANQDWAINLGKSFSLPFKVGNVIRQGGMVSHHIYIAYTDRLATLLAYKNSFVISAELTWIILSLQMTWSFLHLLSKRFKNHWICVNNFRKSWHHLQRNKNLWIWHLCRETEPCF